MIATAQALSAWLAEFKLPVYINNDVPEEVEAPYMTIPMSEPEWDQKTTFYIQIWYRSKSNATLMQKADEIVSAIGQGIKLSCTGGYLVIYPETPLIQLLVDGDYRSAYINLSLNAYKMPGV